MQVKSDEPASRGNQVADLVLMFACSEEVDVRVPYFEAKTDKRDPPVVTACQPRKKRVLAWMV